MAYLIKRYANRKLYDTQTKRYLTLDEIAVLVKAGEQVSVVDADSGEEMTSHVLSKIIADGTRRTGGVVPENLLVELIQRPGEAVFDAFKSSVSAGQRTVEQFGSEVGKLLGGLMGREERAHQSTREVGEELARMIDERLRATVEALDLPRRAELRTLEARIEALEGSLSAHATRAPRATKAKASAKASAKRSAKSRET